MARNKPFHAAIWDTRETRTQRHVDLTLLSGAITRLPPLYWTERMFFRGARDRLLRDLTGGFPATLRKDHFTHPLFVLKPLGGLGHKVCPCSSKNWGAGRFIRKGCTLEITGKEIDRNSYLVEWYGFNLPADPEFTEHLLFMGRVPESCLEPCA
jgi:hypothetical protein